MTAFGGVFVGLGVIFLILGIYFLYAHYKRPTPNEQYLWVGFGDHPFRKRKEKQS